MDNMLARQEQPLPFPGAAEAALRRALEEARQLAAETRLLALNTAIESAGACGEAGAALDMEALGRSAVRSAADMERMAASVDWLLQQIRSAAALGRAL